MSFMMWSFGLNALASIRVKRSSTEPIQICSEYSDDEVCSNASRNEELECLICWESFNIVENVPCVLWCGHNLCKNCILALQCAVVKISTQQIKIPLLIACPWCHPLSFRMVYEGNLKFPHKNFFLLGMVENLNGDRHELVSSEDSQQIWSPNDNLLLENQATNCNLLRASPSLCSGWSGFNGNHGGSVGERHQFSLHKSLDFFIRFMIKFPLAIVLLMIAFFAVTCSAIIVALYLLRTVLFAIPAFLVLYFAYSTLKSLVRELTS